MPGLFSKIKSALKGETSQERDHAAARGTFDAAFRKVIVESMINATLERAQNSGRYHFQLKDEPRHNQVVVAAWELMEFARVHDAWCGSRLTPAG